MENQYLKSGTLLQQGKYRIIEVLGQGGFGITYKAVMKETISGKLGNLDIDVPIAIKEFFMSENCQREDDSLHVTVPSIGMRTTIVQFRHKFVKEAKNLSNLSHPNIVKVIDVFSENDTDYYVMEYLEGGSLRDIIKTRGKIDENSAINYISQIGDALSYMHTQKHMCHYDVKPGNILLDKDGKPKLIDFGISKNYDKDGNQTSSTPVGVSSGFAPLEQYQQSVSEFSPQTDIYALGATLYFLLTGNVPPEASVVFNEGLPDLPNIISQSIHNAINQAMQPRKKDRPQSIKAFLELFQGKTIFSSTGDETLLENNPSIIEKEIEDNEETFYAQDNLVTSIRSAQSFQIGGSVQESQSSLLRNNDEKEKQINREIQFAVLYVAVFVLAFLFIWWVITI